MPILQPLSPNPFSLLGEGEPGSKSLSLLGEGFKVRAAKLGCTPCIPLFWVSGFIAQWFFVRTLGQKYHQLKFQPE
ncbi:MAG: hypothetical protein EBV05_10010 [Cyanobacteria bacterium WB6_1B_304]|nr:hypothetical protein [Cyanobacteria bacterium WB6_1B_304]